VPATCRLWDSVPLRDFEATNSTPEAPWLVSNRLINAADLPLQALHSRLVEVCPDVSKDLQDQFSSYENTVSTAVSSWDEKQE
jgi:hypothetical protein